MVIKLQRSFLDLNYNYSMPNRKSRPLGRSRSTCYLSVVCPNNIRNIVWDYLASGTLDTDTRLSLHSEENFADALEKMNILKNI